MSGVQKMQGAMEFTFIPYGATSLARALVKEPQVLLLDEVMAGLTATELNSFTTLIHQIRNEGTTILLVEHVMQAIMAICDRIIVLHHGQKIAEGTPQEVTTSKKVIEVYLGEQSDAGS